MSAREREPGHAGVAALGVAILGILLAACASLPSPAQRHAEADALAARKNWEGNTIHAGDFDLVAYTPRERRLDAMLTVYIEGDGYAWIDRGQPSADPTPRNPLALRLALAQPDGTAVYLARPCMYVDAEASGCPQRYWMRARFAPEVIAAVDDAIDVLKSRFGASRLTLVGYSGGGAVAALVAARRTDVEKLITVAGNLDHRAWTTLHAVEPLDASLDAADATDALRAIRQWHFAGGLDKIVPPSIIESYANRFPLGRRPIVRIEPDYDHRCCWAEHWIRLWRETESTAGR